EAAADAVDEEATQSGDDGDDDQMSN
ncbi:hypothetical protein A2U01_0059697, partial [Trifolium medium]|nr:hypothetical protein [Trifolium medium]